MIFKLVIYCVESLTNQVDTQLIDFDGYEDLTLTICIYTTISIYVLFVI